MEQRVFLERPVRCSLKRWGRRGGQRHHSLSPQTRTWESTGNEWVGFTPPLLMVLSVSFFPLLSLGTILCVKWYSIKSLTKWGSHNRWLHEIILFHIISSKMNNYVIAWNFNGHHILHGFIFRMQPIRIVHHGSRYTTPPFLPLCASCTLILGSSIDWLQVCCVEIWLKHRFI